MSYTQIPPWLKKQERDPFDYKLRSKEEVLLDSKYFPPEFEWNNQITMYPSGDVREHGNTRIDNRDKKARISLSLKDLCLAPLQRQRFCFLLGPRYKKDSDLIKLSCCKFLTYNENYLRVLEQLREIYWESLRAPEESDTFKRNPYRKEKIIKKMLGKTKEERERNSVDLLQ